MARKKIIAGNWKMNMTPSQAVELVNTLKDLVVNPDVDVVYCVPAIDIVPVVEAVKGSDVAVGAENFYIEDKEERCSPDLRKRQVSRFDKRPSGVSTARRARRG